MSKSINYGRSTYERRIPFQKELRMLAKDFCLLDKPEVLEAIVNCQNYEDGRSRGVRLLNLKSG